MLVLARIVIYFRQNKTKKQKETPQARSDKPNNSQLVISAQYYRTSLFLSHPLPTIDPIIYLVLLLLLLSLLAVTTKKSTYYYSCYELSGVIFFPQIFGNNREKVPVTERERKELNCKTTK